MAFKRMASVHGLPRKVYSDNAPTFKRAEKEILETVRKNNETLENHAKKYDFSWQYSVEYHSAGSGVWERCVRTVKEPLRKVLKGALVTYTELSTIIKEVQAQVNDRPLHEASASTLEVITPSMLCLGRKLRPWVDHYDSTPLPLESKIRERWKHRQNIVRSFFESWAQNYVNSLQQRAKWQTNSPNLKVGDLVLLELQNIKKHKWPLGRVIEIFTGRDGKVRSVRLTTAIHLSPVTRSVHDIYPLEISTERKM